MIINPVEASTACADLTDRYYAGGSVTANADLLTVWKLTWISRGIVFAARERVILEV